MLPLIMAACGAAGAVAAVLTTQAVNEKDRQAVKRYEKVNAELINSRDKLQQRYYELADRSQRQIKDLNLKLAESEMEKDALHLAVRLQNELISLMESIDKNPSLEILVEFKKAIALTNYVLKQLNENSISISQDYFSRTLVRVHRGDDYSKEQLIDFMSVLMSSEQDIATSLLDKVQNGMFSKQHIEAQAIQDSNIEYLEDCIKPDTVGDFTLENRILKMTEAVIEILDNVPGMTQCRASLLEHSRPTFTLKNGTVIRTWTNRMVGGDHVFLVDSNGTMIFGGFVWIYAEELKQAIEQIRTKFAI
jgi:predicted phage tail protein